MKIVTISRDTHDHLLRRLSPGATFNDSQTTYNVDGTVSFPLSDDVLVEMEKLHPDPDMALRIKFGLKTN